MAAAPPAVGPPALVAAPPGPPSWRELYDSAVGIFTVARLHVSSTVLYLQRSIWDNSKKEKRVLPGSDMPGDRTPRRQAAAAAAFRLKEEEDDDDADSEWAEPENSSVEEGEFDDDDDESDKEDQYEDEEEGGEDVKEPPKKPAVRQSTSRKRKAPVYESNDNEDELPSSARLTANGGYAHTKRSRARISKANKGNIPWNKGKNRSQAVRAKIAAGVKARNRAVLLEKLKKLGMTEEEWFAKTKEIKYLRERVRRAKIAAAKREEDGRKSKSKVRNGNCGGGGNIFP